MVECRPADSEGLPDACEHVEATVDAMRRSMVIASHILSNGPQDSAAHTFLLSMPYWLIPLCAWTSSKVKQGPQYDLSSGRSWLPSHIPLCHSHYLMTVQC